MGGISSTLNANDDELERETCINTQLNKQRDSMYLIDYDLIGRRYSKDLTLKERKKYDNRIHIKWLSPKEPITEPLQTQKMIFFRKRGNVWSSCRCTDKEMLTDLSCAPYRCTCARKP